MRTQMKTVVSSDWSLSFTSSQDSVRHRGVKILTTSFKNDWTMCLTCSSLQSVKCSHLFVFSLLTGTGRWDPGTLHYTNCPQCACYPVCQITSGVLHCMSYSEVSLEVPFRPMHPKPEPVTVHPAHSNMETSIFVRNSDVCDLELTAWQMPHGSQSLWRCSTLRAKCFLRMIRLYEMFKIWWFKIMLEGF